MNTHDIYIDWEFPGTNPYKPLLTRVIAAALEAEGVRIPCGVDVLLTDDEGIREINREQREVDSVTDVLSFPMLNRPPTPGTPRRHREEEFSRPPENRPVLPGDMVIDLNSSSVPRPRQRSSATASSGELALSGGPLTSSTRWGAV